MSRFFAGGSDSESDSSEEEVVQPTFGKIATTYAVSIFCLLYVAERGITFPFFPQFSDDEEDVKRVVRSAKEKRYEELSNIIKNIRNSKKIKDMSSILTSFEDLTRAYTKALRVITKEENGVTPRFYIRCLAELEDFINEVWEDRDGRKNLSKNNLKSLGTLRQKVRKYIKDFEVDMKKFREAPDAESEEEVQKVESESESEDEDVKKPAPVMKAAAFKKEEKAPKPVKADDDSDSSVDWGSSDDSETESSEDENAYTSIREKFLKKQPTDKEDKYTERDEKKKEKKVKERNLQKKKEEDDEEGWETVTKGSLVEKPKMFAKDAEINEELVLNKLLEIMSARGKNRTDRKMSIELLYELKHIAEQNKMNVAIIAKILYSIITAIFDYNPKISEPMKIEFWDKLLKAQQDLLAILLSQKENVTLAYGITEDQEQLETAPYFIRGCALAIVEKLDDEFIKLLKECDPHSNDYVERLKDEVNVTKIIDSVTEYIERIGNSNEKCRVYLRKIEHLYYKFDPNVLNKKYGKLPATTTTSVDEMQKLCNFIYTNDETDRIRTRAILVHIYHHALHDNWFQARDLVLMSHLQDNIDSADPPTKILYNRMMANLGLCAFRQGNIKDAHR